MADHESELLAPTPGARVSTFLKRKDVSQTLLLWIFFTAVFVVLVSGLIQSGCPSY